MLMYADELDDLRRWKAEAMTVLGAWDEVWIALGQPGKPGQSMAAASKTEAMRLRAIEGRLASMRQALAELG